MDPRYLRRIQSSSRSSLAGEQRPPRPVGHMESHVQYGNRVVLDEGDLQSWDTSYAVMRIMFPRTTRHRREVRWSRRLTPLLTAIPGPIIVPPPPPPPQQLVFASQAFEQGQGGRRGVGRREQQHKRKHPRAHEQGTSGSTGQHEQPGWV